MTNTLETGYSSYLTRKLEAADTTAYVATVPTVTKGRLFITDGVNKERIQFTGVSGSTLTGLTRGLSKTADPSTAGTGTAWIAGTTIKLVAMHDQLVDKQEATTFGDIITVSDTSVAGIRLQSLTTAQMNAIASPVNGDIIYNSTAGENYQYIGGAWSAVSAGSTQANSSTTVAGKVETATTAESIAANADTGGTGANLVVLPSDIAKNTQSATFVYGADAGGDDTYVVALTPVLASYTTGQRLQFKVTTANTGACSVDFGPGAKNIKTLDGNDPQTGAIRASQVVTVVYDGTNMILQNEDIASTTNKGIAELATDAEAIARSDATRYVTPAHLGLVTQVAILQGTRAANAASGNQTFAHGLSTTPKWIEVVCMGRSTDSLGGEATVISQGRSTGSVHKCTYFGGQYTSATENVAGNSATNCAVMYFITATGESLQQATAAFDDTNVTLTRTFTQDTPDNTETMYITILAHT